MNKINFTPEHKARLYELATEMLFNNDVIITKLGQPCTIVDLLHNTTINSLNNIKLNLTKRIESLEQQDEWISSNAGQVDLENTKHRKELINLIIGYKRYNSYLEEVNIKRNTLKTELIALKESQKTPEDKIKELEEQLKALD